MKILWRLVREQVAMPRVFDPLHERLCAEATMKTKPSGELSQYVRMEASAQQFFKEATACREEATRSLDQVDREGWLKLAHEWTELALVAERGQIFRRD
ncbi:hypothetical protein ABIF69_003288 [Bradyrhizobium japonicum]